MLPGNLLEVSDGKSAYTQACLKGKKTWVTSGLLSGLTVVGIPDPVVVLVLALHGRPDAGGNSAAKPC